MDAELTRVLLGNSNDEYGPAGDTTDARHDNTQTLRIISIFVILSMGLLGGIPPLFIKVFRDPDSLPTRLVRSFAAGVILALALVHIIPEAVEAMDGLGGITYPLGGTTILFGVVLMVTLEHLAHMMHTHGDTEEDTAHHAVHAHSLRSMLTVRSTVRAVRSLHGGSGVGAKDLLQEQGSKSGPAGDQTPNQADCTIVRIHGDVEFVPMESAVAAAASPRKQLQAAAAPCSQAAAAVAVACAGAGAAECVDVEAGLPDLRGHSHAVVSHGGSAADLGTAVAGKAVEGLRHKIVAYLFELGCIFHSFIIGLSLGVNQTDLQEVRALLIALAFHQWLEGIGLASVVIRGGFPLWRSILMVISYSLTCPAGIAVGMGVASTYDPETTTARAVQGALNGVSGGMLLYVSLVQLVAEDMSRLVPGRGSAVARLVCVTALIGGAAAMCAIAVWA